MPLPVSVVADELRARQPAVGKLKLHKLLYYCQGHHLATFGQPLFSETISAWDHGPVVGQLWFAESRAAVEIDRVQATPPGEGELNTIGYVVSRYGALSGKDLEHLTHCEDPWRWADADRAPRTSKRIPQEWIRAYFAREDRDDADDDAVVDAVEVKEWLRDAAARRDTPGTHDDPEQIRRRMVELRSRRSE